MKNIKVIIGSTREGRVGEPVAQWVAAQAEVADVKVEIVDIKSFDLPFVYEAVPPAYMHTQDPKALEWAKVIGDADAYVFVTSEYNRGLPASLKNAIDFLVDEWKGKKAAIVSYGYVDGGKSATSHLKDVLGWLKVDIAGEVQLQLAQEMFNNGAFIDINAAFADSAQSVADVLRSLND